MDATRESAVTRQRPRLLSALNSANLLIAVALAVSVGLGIGLRFYGLDWDAGYGYTPHPDERAILGKVGELGLPTPLNFFDAEESPWNPRWFPYGSFPLYTLKLTQVATSAVSGVDIDDLRGLGRAISALADLATLLTVYLLAARIYGRREAVLASALVALAVLHIQLSHFFAVDTILGLTTVAALFFMFRVATRGRLRDSVVAGVLIGLGLATKLSQAPIYVAFVMAHILYVAWPDGDDRPIGERLGAALTGVFVGGTASIMALAVTQPYAFLDWSRFYADFVEQSEMVRRIRDYPYTRQYIDTTPYVYHVRQLATWGLGWPLGIVAWAGLLYAALRGMRLRFGLAYLAVGWLLPASVLMVSTSIVAIVLATTIAFGALIGSLACRSPSTRGEVLLLSWVVPYLLITGAFEVKFLRYLLPVTPVLVLFGSRMLIAAWDQTKERLPALRLVVVAAVAVVVVATALYAISYTSVYAADHTAVRTSQWLNANGEIGDVILMEHWEEGIPNLDSFNVLTLNLYDDDSQAKLLQLSRDLSRADYIVFFSNRLYGTVPRLPERYPATSAYYRLLFSRGLGYELANAETAYPGLLGVNFVDDTIGRPGLASPGDIEAFQPDGATLNLGFADESFSVYDHPKGLVFENVERLDAGELQQRIGQASGGEIARGDMAAPTQALLLSAEEVEARRAGGTWTEIVSEGSWTSRCPALAWLLLIELIGLVALPITLVLFRPLSDRGFLFSKALGLMVVGLGAWLSASLGWLAFSRGSIGLSLAVTAAASIVLLVHQRRAIVGFVRERWRALLFAEALFLVAFVVFVVVRMANPDLWHSWLGGEKPMDMAYLNAVLRSEFMPPYDPWFAGGFMNYYYWGQFLTATMIRATGIDPAVAYNLAIALFFALVVAGAYTIVYNLAASSRRGLSPVIAGLGGVAFVVVIGNLDGAIQVGQGVWRALFLNQPFGGFDFWRSTRMMPPGSEITEFPFFTFLFGDLHAHLMALPYTLLALGLALAVVLGVKERAWSAGELFRLAALGVTVGALRVINTWDYPTYLLIGGAAVLLAGYLRNGGFGLKTLVDSGLKFVIVFAVGYAVFLPFHVRYETFFTSIEGTTNQTILWRFLAIMGLFIFVIASFYMSEARGWLLPTFRGLARAVGGRRRSVTGARAIGPAAFVGAALTVGLVGAIYLSGVLGSTIPFLLGLLALVLVVGVGTLLSRRPDAPELAFVSTIVAMALALAVGLDVFRVEGDIDRMNTVFKFYLQIWVILALASAYLLWRLARDRKMAITALSRGKLVWVTALAILIAGSLVYTALGTRARLAIRFDTTIPLTLDGTAYMSNAVYPDENGALPLGPDYAGIRWLQREVEGSPVVLEGQTPFYRWGGRVSIYTGLPTVVGWQWHQEQQRWGYRGVVQDRIRDVNRIYGTTDPTEARALLDKYGVRYIYVGPLERLYYDAGGLVKFDDHRIDGLEEVFSTDEVTIFEVGPVGDPIP